MTQMMNKQNARNVLFLVEILYLLAGQKDRLEKVKSAQQRERKKEKVLRSRPLRNITKFTSLRTHTHRNVKICSFHEKLPLAKSIEAFEKVVLSATLNTFCRRFCPIAKNVLCKTEVTRKV